MFDSSTQEHICTVSCFQQLLAHTTGRWALLLNVLKILSEANKQEGKTQDNGQEMDIGQGGSIPRA